MRLRTDHALRQSLYGLYVALFKASKACPADFPRGRLTTIQTAIMGIENYGWRVIGITREALDLLATVDFDKNKLPRRLCRGHIINRSDTAEQLFGRDNPMSLEDYFDTYLLNDCTVIMLNDQNTHPAPVPKYIEIDNPDAELFQNGSLMGWKHRNKEREYLRLLHTKLLAK